MSKSNDEVIVVVPMVIIQALQLDDESVCDHYRIKRLSGNQYLFGAYGLKVLREHHNAQLQARRDNGEWIPRERFL